MTQSKPSHALTAECRWARLGMTMEQFPAAYRSGELLRHPRNQPDTVFSKPKPD